MKNSPENLNDKEIDFTDSNKETINYKLDKEKAGISDNFDIVDFALKHNQTYSVRKKSKLPKIIACVFIFLLIVVICVLGAILGGTKQEKKPASSALYGAWVSGDVTMYIDENYITIDGEKKEYLIEEDSVIALKIYQGDYFDYYKMIYSIDGDNLTILIPNGDTGKMIEYKRK